MVLSAAPQVCGVCRDFPALSEATAWMRCSRRDVSPTLRVFRGAGGLQSAEKGPNSKHDPGVDGSTVSPATEQSFVFLSFLIISVMDQHLVHCLRILSHICTKLLFFLSCNVASALRG